MFNRSFKTLLLDVGCYEKNKNENTFFIFFIHPYYNIMNTTQIVLIKT